MPVLFISHASKDDAFATALEAWLNANGFTDIFVNHHSIAGGDKWGEALRASAGACRAVFCLVTQNWLASVECFSEFRASAAVPGTSVLTTPALPSATRTPQATRTTGSVSGWPER